MGFIETGEAESFDYRAAAGDSRSVVHERFGNEEFANLGQFDR